MLIKSDLVEKVISSIGPKYFDADDFTEISKSRTGLFGVVTETMGTIFENSTVNNAIQMRERLTITASRQTLLQEAAGYPELVIPGSNPATMQVMVGIPIDYLVNRWIVEPTKISFTLEKDTEIKVSELDYKLPYSILINGNLIDGKFLYSAQFLIDDQNPLYTLSNPYIITMISNVDGINYLFLNIDIMQMTKKYDYHSVLQTDAVSLNGIDFAYEGQLAYFNIMYKSATGSSFTKIPQLNYYSNLTSEEPVYVYYLSDEQGKITIFIPDNVTVPFNSEFRVDIYTTEGSKANFTFNTGTLEVLPSSFENSIDYTGLAVRMVILGDSKDGADELSTDEIRSRIIEYKSTLRSIDTETDLTNFFKNSDAVNNMVFIKKRIDIFEKQYAAFMTLRDSTLGVYATNTLNLEIDHNSVNQYFSTTQRRMIYPSTAYSLKPGQDFQIVKNTDILTDSYIKTAEEDNTKFLFGCPYLMVINENPISTSYYLNSIDKEYNMNLDYTNENATFQFIMYKMRIRRNAINNENKYTIQFNLIPTTNLPEGIIDEAGNIINTDIIKVYGYLFDENNKNVKGYFNLELKNYDRAQRHFVVEGTLETDDYITLNDELRIINSIYEAGSSTATDHIVNADGVRLGVGVYYQTTPTTKGEYLSIIPNMDAYQLVNVYSNNMDRTTFMINMSRIIRTSTSLLSGGENPNFSVEQVPVVRYSVLKNNIGNISSILSNTDRTIKMLLNQIKNNSSVDFKFYATYGKSKYFSMENTSTKLDRLDIKLKFKLRMSKLRSDSAVVPDIKAFIKPLIEQMNILDIDQSIYFSNIITQVENEFKYRQARILSFEIVKINDFDTIYQSIVNNTKDLSIMTKTELLEFVPELVKIDLNNIDIELLLV